MKLQKMIKDLTGNHMVLCTVLVSVAWQADSDCCRPTSRFGCPFISVRESRHFERIICCDWCYLVVSTSCVHHIQEIFNELRQVELKFWNYDAKIHVKQMSTGLIPCLMPTKQHHLVHNCKSVRRCSEICA